MVKLYLLPTRIKFITFNVYGLRLVLFLITHIPQKEHMFEKSIDNIIFEYYDLDVDKKNICSSEAWNWRLVIIPW